MQKTAVLYDAGQAVLSTFDPDEVLQRILAIARDYFHLQNAAILLLDADRQELCVRSQIGWAERQDQIRLGHREGLSGSTITTKKPSICLFYFRRRPQCLCRTPGCIRWSGNGLGNWRLLTPSHSKAPRFSTLASCWARCAC